MKRFMKVISLFLVISVFFGILPLMTSAVSAGDTYAPDAAKWGTQNNNGWYYMYQNASGQYVELDYYDGTAAITWQKNAFAFDPNAMNEMLFINNGSFFTGEYGSKPVYAFQAPSGGQIELTVLTHGLSDVQMEILRNSEKLETVAFSTTGSENGFTKTVLTIDVKVNTWIYLVCSTTGTNREGWVKDYSVKYLSVNNETETEDTIQIYTPDPNKWGTQGDNGWYYMYKNSGGQYHELDYYDSTAAITWQKNAYAFNPDVMNEMLFISRSSFFTGENGSKPVYAFQAPAGGQVELTVLTHGQSDVRMDILRNDETLKTISFSTTGSENGFTKTVLTIDVKANTWLYLVCSTTGANREGWVKGYSVKYLSVNDEKEEEENELIYTPDLEKWGTQDNNGWFYMHKGLDNTYAEMTYRDSTAKIEWQRNRFASDPDTDQEMYFISQQQFFVGELGTKPTYAFSCPQGGRIELTVITHGEPGISMEIYQNKTLVDTIAFSREGELSGYTKNVFTLDVKAGTWLYLVGVGNGSSREGFVNYYGVKYLSVNDEKETEDDSIVGTVYTPDVKKLKQNNNGWYYMYYDSLTKRYEQLPKYGSDAAIEWQRNAFASDPDKMFEMLFMTNDHYFVGENGTCPVYAFKCPAGGKVKLTVFTHGKPDMYMNVYYNDKLLDNFHYTTEGASNGFTEHVVETQVEKGGWIYLVCGSDGEDRDGWLSFYGVEYLQASSAISKYQQPDVYIADVSDNWGKQDNNGWYFSYLDKTDNLFRKLAFVRADNCFQGSTEGGYEYLLIKELEMHPSLKGNPAKVFSCPQGGQVEFSFQAWMQNAPMSPTGTGIALYHNGVKIWPAEGDYHKLDGSILLQRVQVNVAKGDDLAVVIDALEENNSYDATNVRACVRYLSYNDTVRTQWPEYPKEEAPDISVPDVSVPDVTAPSEGTTPGQTGDPTAPSQNNANGQQSQEPNGASWVIIVLIVILAAGAITAGIILFLKKSKKKRFDLLE